MAQLRVAVAVFERDLVRIVDHLSAHEVSDIETRLATILAGLEVLRAHPLIGRPCGEGLRELVLGRGSRGHVALYRFDDLDDAVDVLALRAQREAGYADPTDPTDPSA